MRHTNNMINIAQTKLQQLICNDGTRIAEAKQTVIGEDSMQRHGPCM